MPAAVGKGVPLPEWMDPSKATDDDPLYQTLLRKAVSFSGIDNPETSITSMMQPMGMISIYKDPLTGVPSAEMRARATESFIKNAYKLDPRVGRAAEWLAQKYPRVAAHTALRDTPREIDDLGRALIYEGKVTSPVPVMFGRRGLETEAEDSIRNTLGHEMVHVAQALGNSDTWNLYGIARNLTNHERQIPHEITANLRGKVSQKGSLKAGQAYFKGTKEPYTVPKGMRWLFDTLQKERYNLNNGERSLLNMLGDIIEKRGY